jgi:hypothetical protein
MSFKNGFQGNNRSLTFDPDIVAAGTCKNGKVDRGIV